MRHSIRTKNCTRQDNVDTFIRENNLFFPTLQQSQRFPLANGPIQSATTQNRLFSEKTYPNAQTSRKTQTKNKMQVQRLVHRFAKKTSRLWQVCLASRRLLKHQRATIQISVPLRDEKTPWLKTIAVVFRITN